MRNGDYTPSRFEAQQDAANLICGTKTQQNPENQVAILTMAGKRCVHIIPKVDLLSPRVQVAPTSSLGKLLATLSSIKISGESNFSASLRVAQVE